MNGTRRVLKSFKVMAGKVILARIDPSAGVETVERGLYTGFIAGLTNDRDRGKTAP
jgi:hypothetical protein